MSASPAQQPPGSGTPTPTATGAAPAAIRKKPAVNIFAKKRPVKKAQPTRPGASSQTGTGSTTKQTRPAQQSTASNSNAALRTASEEDGKFEEFPIIVSRNTLSQGLRYHVMKFQGKTDENGQVMPVNPYDDESFVRPLKLHRRFARDQLQTAEQPENASGIDDKERESMLTKKLERQAERESNQKLIAPAGGEAVKPTKKKPSKKVEEGRDETNQNRLRRQQLRYEEARPWHLEDFESKNVWVGSYEAPLSGQSVMFIVDQSGYFQLVPVEKWYKFIQTNKVNTMDSEEVEKHMNRKFNYPRWALGTQLANDEHRREQTMRVKQERIARKREEADDGESEMKMAGDDYQADVDQIDFDFGEDNMFQDDDEGKLIEAAEGEDSKEIERRIHEEMRNAGLGGTGVKDEELDDFEEYRQQQFAEMDEKKKSRRLRKQLLKKERKFEYESDSDENLYGDSSEDDEDGSDEERNKAEAEKKKEDAKKAAMSLGDKSGASSRGNNTPNGRAEKRDPSRLGVSLGKRAGSPDASDMSGNESSRKKVKSLHGQAVTSNAVNGARSDFAKRKVGRPLAGGSGSGSDTDTSRAGRTRMRLKNSPPGSPAPATPNGSRAASPAASGNRVSSPKPGSAVKKDFPTLLEVRSAIPPEGIEIKTLVSLFRSQVAGRNSEFINLVKAAGQQNRQTGKIMPKTSTPPA